MARNHVMRTPLGRVRGLGTARTGTGHFWRQRVTAVANLPLVVFFVALMATLAGADHARVVEVIACPWVAPLLLLAVLSVTVHMRLGMQVVIEDYVHSEAGKFALLIANTLFCVGVGVVAAFSILKIAFGA